MVDLIFFKNFWKSYIFQLASSSGSQLHHELACSIEHYALKQNNVLQGFINIDEYNCVSLKVCFFANKFRVSTNFLSDHYFQTIIALSNS